MKKNIIEISSLAIARIKKLINESEKFVLGIRVGVKQGGCSGLSYTFEYCDKPNSTDEVVTQDGVTVFIAVDAIMFIIGSIMDYTDDNIKSGFIFINPNEASKCGCGTSFSIK